jgi:hypothetical protein
MGSGTENLEGELLLEFAETMKLIVTNAWFQKGERQKVTYESGGNRTVIDYVLIRRCDREDVRDVKVIGSEACISQHKLMVCVLVLKESVVRKKKTFESKCRIWWLKDADLQSSFCEQVRLRAMDRSKEKDV